MSLSLKPPCLAPVGSGLSFCGFRVFPKRVLLSRRAKERFVSRLHVYEARYRTGEWDENALCRHVEPLVAHTRWAAAKGFRKSVLENMRRVHRFRPRDPGRQLEQQPRQRALRQSQQQHPGQSQQQLGLPPFQYKRIRQTGPVHGSSLSAQGLSKLSSRASAGHWTKKNGSRRLVGLSRFEGRREPILPVAFPSGWRLSSIHSVRWIPAVVQKIKIF